MKGSSTNNFPTLLMGLCVFFWIAISCQKEAPTEEELLICTKNFVTLTLKITGEAPTSFYTVRKATGDTLWYEAFSENVYPIVDDKLVAKMEKDQVEEFQFVALRPQNPINTLYTIKSDGCHVVKLEGLDTIE